MDASSTNVLSPLQLGQRIEFRCLTSDRVFRGTLLAFLGEHFCWVTDGTGLKARPVKRDRLKHIGTL